MTTPQGRINAVNSNSSNKSRAVQAGTHSAFSRSLVALPPVPQIDLALRGRLRGLAAKLLSVEVSLTSITQLILLDMALY